MKHININTQETNIPDTIGITKGITWENSTDLLKSLGWRIKPELPPVADEYERLSILYVDGYEDTATAIYTDTLIQDRLDREEVERIAQEEQAEQQAIIDEQNRQASKSLELKKAENNFLLVCEQITGSKNKLGFDELEAIIGNLMTSSPELAVPLTLKLLTIDATGKRAGGLLWWDDIVWHEEIV